ncbi:hypothetical protein [Legionella brunensis]|uniref:hypothetical protein n=1 Tax=Legionella brunensis TaxID=29422 RepID=UPI0010414860|nr:hypothetical protein [Legionella brunensis]
MKRSLKELEKAANEPSFISYLKSKSFSNKSMFELRKEYDLLQLNKVYNGIRAIKKDHLNSDDVILKQISVILTDIKKTAKKQIESYDLYYQDDHFSQLAKQYATHFIPFNQSNDPFKGSDFSGFCWGHSHRYGRLASKGLLDQLSSASDKKLYSSWKTNWTFADILFRRVGWYFWVSQEVKIRQALWNFLKQLDDKTTLNFNFLVSNWGFHSTGLRMVGDGIEYYENNCGIVKFSNRENAVNFLARHLLHSAEIVNGEIKFLTVYKLPYENIAEHDIFADVPQSLIQRGEIKLAEAEKIPLPPEITGAIDALETYADKLRNLGDIKAKIKANEIKYLTAELALLPIDKIKARVEGILGNKDHSLVINRGTGFYFFKTGFQSHCTTETLLQEIQKACESEEKASLVM